MSCPSGSYRVDIVGAIAASAFENCDSLVSVTIGPNVTSIGNWAFYDCDSLSSVSIGDSVSSIGERAFAYCGSLGSVTIGDSVTSIGSGAFYRCDSLSSVTIGDSVTSIGERAFAYCGSLTGISVSSANPAFCCQGGVLFNKEMSTLVQFPGGVGGDYRIPDSVTSIGSYAFENCGKLEYVVYAGAAAPQCGSSVFSGTAASAVHVVSGYVGTSVCGVGVIGDYVRASCGFSVHGVGRFGVGSRVALWCSVFVYSVV